MDFLLEVSEQSCEWKGSQVCEGAVTLETKSLLQVDDVDDDIDDGAEFAYKDVDDLVKPPSGHGGGVAFVAHDDDYYDHDDD